ncbi:SpoIIIAH-like family protein [Pseudalkalibacillus hwajinpoensis]|uniref:SpoIIIAH-like family protein n=1 Tax=Guptibacillus hwajinpoensis TaxID=208199 RepID=A0A4U1MHU5_9BACL|nr:SpoIIIAH-like family protein [Pseudalkalibacillus hwajinpoensis]TKD70065.1 SpoIIIAH-like family protein [Pseudalkalibacillus hwajinpoensis]
MVLKKQTVWLLTMLSLIIVLSAYYIMTPGTDNVAFVGDQEQSQDDAKSNEAKETNAEGDVVSSSLSSDEAFAALRLEIQEQRDAAIEDYTAVIASEASADLRNEAHEQRQELMALSQQESVLENVIKSEGYSDAVVYTLENDKVRVIVKADQLSNEEANNIMVLAQEQLGEGHQIAVEFQPAAK